MELWSYYRDDTLDIKVGYRCNNACIHCVVEPIRKTLINENRKLNLSTGEIKAFIDKARRESLKAVVLTGGEVTIRPDLRELVEYASKAGLKVTMQTNGNGLADPATCDLLAPFNPYFIVALHAANADVHDAVTRVQGSFDKTVSGIRNLLERRQKVAVKMVLSSVNYRFVADTACLVSTLGVRELCIVFPHALDFTPGAFDRVVPRYSDICGHLGDAAAFCERNGITVTYETIPYCILSEVKHFWLGNCDLHAKANAVKLPNIEDGMFDWEDLRPSMKSKGEQCRRCAFTLICEGPWKEYTDHYGFEEFAPLPAEAVNLIAGYENTCVGPVTVEAWKADPLPSCGRGRTQSPPHCDGTHHRL